MNRSLFILILAAIGALLARAQTPLVKLGPYQTKAITPLPPTVEYISTRPWRNVPAPFATPANVSTNPIKQGWQAWSSSAAFCTDDPRWLRVVSGNPPYDGRWGHPHPSVAGAQIFPITVRKGALTNWVLYEMGIVWNPADAYSEFLPDIWEYRTRVNLGRLVTNREVDRISYPWLTLAVATGWHRIEFTTNLRDWTLEQTVLGPTQLVCDIDERHALGVWRKVKQ